MQIAIIRNKIKTCRTIRLKEDCQAVQSYERALSAERLDYLIFERFHEI